MIILKTLQLFLVCVESFKQNTNVRCLATSEANFEKVTLTRAIFWPNFDLYINTTVIVVKRFLQTQMILFSPLLALVVCVKGCVGFQYILVAKYNMAV